MNILDPSSPMPLYQQMVVQLQNRIASGEFAPRTFMPGEFDLSRSYGVSRITARRALDELAVVGLVKRERGRGTSVLDRAGSNVMRTSIDGWLENIRLMQSTTDVRLLEFDYLKARPEVACALELPEGTEVQRSVRVRSFEGSPMSYLVCFLPGEIGRSFEADDLNSKAMMKLLEYAGHRVVAARQTISAALATPDTAEALGVYAGAPLLEVRRIALCSDERVVQYIRALYRPELYHIEIAMTRKVVPGGSLWSAQEEVG